MDAHRGAFTALAISRGWSQARIGRYLGVQRVRVGQRVEKLMMYASRDDCPVLHEVITARRPGPVPNQAGVGFAQEDWRDLEFAMSLIDIVA